MSKYGIILKVGNKYIHVGMTREAQSTQVVNTEQILKELISEDHRQEGMVLEFPGTEPATEYEPGGPGGGGRQVPIQHDLLELREDLEEQRVQEVQQPEEESNLQAVEDALELLEKAADREETYRSLVQEYQDLQQGQSDHETVPEVAEAHDVHVRTLYRVVKERLTKDDRILPKRLVEDQAEAV